MAGQILGAILTLAELKIRGLHNDSGPPVSRVLTVRMCIKDPNHH